MKLFNLFNILVCALSFDTLVNAQDAPYPFRLDNLLPWSIATFDSENRSAQERVRMVAEIGFSQYVFGGSPDQRKHMKKELSFAQDEGLDIHAVYLSTNLLKADTDSLEPIAETLFQDLAEAKIETTVWITLRQNGFLNVDPNVSLHRATHK